MNADSVILKISGEALCSGGSAYCASGLEFLKTELEDILKMGIRPALILGGGNIYRGRKGVFTRVNGDRMGMLATVMNSIAVSDFLTSHSIRSKPFSSVEIGRFVDLYRTENVLAAMEEGIVPVFGGGTANPYFSTDSLAALRALELEIPLILKGSTVDGIYDKDPNKFKDALLQKEIIIREGGDLDVGVIFDPTAFYLAQTGKTKLVVYNFFEKGNTKKAYNNQIGTFVKWED